MKKSRAVQIATNRANQARSSHQQRAVDRTTAFDEASRPTQVVGFDADRGKMIVQSLGNEAVAVGVPITNGGLAIGRSADVDGGYVGGMPRTLVTEEIPERNYRSLKTVLLYYTNETIGYGSHGDTATTEVKFWLKFDSDQPAVKIFEDIVSYGSTNDLINAPVVNITGYNHQYILTLVNRNIKIVQLSRSYGVVGVNTIDTGRVEIDTLLVDGDRTIFQHKHRVNSNLLSVLRNYPLLYPDELSDYTDYLSPSIIGYGALEFPPAYRDLEANTSAVQQANPRSGKFQQFLIKDTQTGKLRTFDFIEVFYKNRFELVDRDSWIETPETPRILARSREIQPTPDELEIPDSYRPRKIQGFFRYADLPTLAESISAQPQGGDDSGSNDYSLNSLVSLYSVDSQGVEFMNTLDIEIMAKGIL